jgi:serine phosphatase RsbU (regulator of sigma subunit)
MFLNAMKHRPRYLFFKLSVALGLLLGLILLTETVATYHYVAGVMVHQEAQREAQRRALSIGRAGRLTHARDPRELAPVLDELVRESPQQIAWIRIVDSDGEVLADTPKARSAIAIPPERLRRVFGDRDRIPAPLEIDAGKTIIIAQPFRMPGPPSHRPGSPPRHPGPPPMLEIAIFIEGVSVHYGLLRRNLIIGSSAAIALMVAVAIIAFRFRHYMRGRRIEQELAVARRVQFDLFPSEAIQSRSVDFAAECVPALQVGGDLYDVFEVGGGEVCMLLGDVSGKGLPAALLMGVVQGAVRASRITGAPSNHEDAAERLNSLLCSKTARERFVSLFWAYFDPLESRLSYINAGHLPPLLIKSGGPVPRVERLQEGGPVLGVLPSAHYRQAHCVIESGDLLVVYSDGILEAANHRGEEFGEERVIGAVLRGAGSEPAAICQAILRDVREFLGSELPQDDQTLMVVRMQRLLPDLASADVRQTPADVH